jgi:hypothetical protein
MVKVTHLHEVQERLILECGEDCPSIDMYHIEMSIEAFAELVRDPQAFSREYEIPLSEGDVHISLSHRQPTEARMMAAAITPTPGPVPVPSICVTLVAGSNQFCGFVWPRPNPNI